MKFENIASNAQNHFTLMYKMRWSKNIMEEQDAPEQIILGLMDMHLCPLLNLAICLETRGHNMGNSDFLYDRTESGQQ